MSGIVLGRYKSATGVVKLVELACTVDGLIVTAETPVATNGVALPVNSLSQTLGYDGSGNVTSMQVTYEGVTYTQTLTYTGGKLTNISRWVAA